jgi:hypothetical protein
LLIRSDFSNAPLYVAVVGHNGIYSPTPYSLQIELAKQADIETLLGDACNGTPLVAPATNAVQVLHSEADANTLYVTQRERFKAVHGEDGWSAVADKLFQGNAALARQSSAAGNVISLPSSIFDGWDSSPCSVEGAIATAEAVQEAIRAHLNPQIRYVVIVGGDNIVPFLRVPDGTDLNERTYTSEALLRPGSPLDAALRGGFILTDDCNVDPDTGVRDREVCLPTRSVSRLVENPDEIIAVIDGYLETGGQLALGTATVSGYDFFADSSEEMFSTLSTAGLETDTLISDFWTADDLRCSLLGEPASDSSCATPDLGAFNAHFNHFLGLSAWGFNVNDLSDVLTSQDVSGASNGAPALGYTIGCHTGYSVPDGSGLPPEFGLPFNPALDFAQAMATQKAVYVANTGYGIGTEVGVGANERLLADLTVELAGGSTTVGEALVNAKRRYLSGLNTVTVYDQKASLQTVMYGLPMYSLSVAGAAQASAVQGAQLTGATAGNFELTLVDNGTSTSTHKLEKITTDLGEFYTADGDHQATMGRAIQPRVTKDLSGTDPVHGVLIRGGSFTDWPGIDPVITKFTHEWEATSEGSVNEINACVNAFFPSLSLMAKTKGESLTVIPGQFRCTSGLNPVVTGIERLYESLTVEVQRSASNDRIPPEINEVDIQVTSDSTATLTVDANDPSGISELVVLLVDNGVISSVSSGPLTGAGPYVMNLSGLGADTKLAVQVVDGAGNVGMWAGKGVNIRRIQVESDAQTLASTLAPSTLTATVFGFLDLLEESEAVSYVWDFGDATFETGDLAIGGNPAPGVLIDADGNATFTVTHQYQTISDLTATVKITDLFGGIGVDFTKVQLCGDPAEFSSIDPNGDLVVCGVQNSATAFTVQLQVAPTGVISNDYQFRLHLDIGNGKKGKQGSFEPDGNEDLMLKYDNGNVTGIGGLDSLTATLIDARTVQFAFDLADLGWNGNRIQWFAETQSGVQSEGGVGFADRMPDVGFFGYGLQ